ncbi:hypothetical protein HPB51_021707 [Rhipicephalus microplus]|uniref:Uncharacterized protein n=1 Tax=Rhipicephalus microplus TaxID=6941 RepID=A0A9J6D781_RHIMP|nr:hypothetical protein HPB51_021707 [Rhipicephalus microplus]
MPLKQRCHHSLEGHPPPRQGELPTCAQCCIVFIGAQNTASSNCKYCFINKAPPTPQLKQEAQEPTWNTHRNPCHSGPSSSHSPSLRDHSASFPSLGNSQQQRRESRSPFVTRRPVVQLNDVTAGPDYKPGAQSHAQPNDETASPHLTEGPNQPGTAHRCLVHPVEPSEKRSSRWPGSGAPRHHY